MPDSKLNELQEIIKKLDPKSQCSHLHGGRTRGNSGSSSSSSSSESTTDQPGRKRNNSTKKKTKREPKEKRGFYFTLDDDDVIDDIRMGIAPFGGVTDQVKFFTF